MKVNRGNGQPLGPEVSRPANRVEADSPKSGGSPKSERKNARDSVEISSAGRSRAEQLAARIPLSDERVAELRERIVTGAYSTDAVVNEVATRIIASGDL